MKNNLLFGSIAAFTPFSLFAGTVSQTQSPDQQKNNGMNVILFLVDDMGWGDLGYLGNTIVESPNLDQFAETSTVFTNAYAAPESSPTRASLLTGKNPARLHITTWLPQNKPGDTPRQKKHKGWNLPDEAQSVQMSEYMLSEALRDNGYNTWHIGKWHIGEGDMNPRNKGFDCDIGFWPWSYPKSYFSPYGLPTLEDGPKGEYLTDRLTHEAAELIRGNDGKPFFLNLWHYAVHEPLRAPDAEVDYYISKGAPEEGKDKAVYSAMKQSIDRSFAEILRAVEEAGVADNTIIIFFTDNGGVPKHADNGPLRDGKKSLYEGGIRVPLIIRHPAAGQGATVDTPVSSIDFYATILEMTGIDIATVRQKMDGVSFAPLLLGGEIAERTLFWHELGTYGHGPATAMRKGDYKLLKFYTRPENQFELYDLSADISETNDLSSKMSEKVKDMNKEMERWIKDNKAQLPWKAD